MHLEFFYVFFLCFMLKCENKEKDKIIIIQFCCLFLVF